MMTAQDKAELRAIWEQMRDINADFVPDHNRAIKILAKAVQALAWQLEHRDSEK